MLTPLINATGVLLHTNLGRAPLSFYQSADYSNLELDLDTGERGDRQTGAPALLARACGAEAAMAVNNCAAAVMLVLAALAEGRDAVVSRGELVRDRRRLQGARRDGLVGRPAGGGGDHQPHPPG